MIRELLAARHRRSPAEIRPPYRTVCYRGVVPSRLADGTRARDRITETASLLFYAEGIHAVGVDRVVSDAGVAKATLYQHFRSKEELVAACLRERSARWRRHFAEPILSRPGSPAARVARVFDVLSRSVAEPGFRGCPFINAAAEYPGQEGPVAAAIRAHRAAVRSLFADLVAPLPAPSRRKDLVDQLVLLYDGTMISAQLDWTSKPNRSARAAATRLLEDGAGA
jgi:AcrR family transcriptional regulator